MNIIKRKQWEYLSTKTYWDDYTNQPVQLQNLVICGLGRNWKVRDKRHLRPEHVYLSVEDIFYQSGTYMDIIEQVRDCRMGSDNMAVAMGQIERFMEAELSEVSLTKLMGLTKSSLEQDSLHSSIDDKEI